MQIVGHIERKDDRHIHLGGGQTEVEITLPAGRHRLQLLLGDYLHVPHNPPVMSKPITITVKPYHLFPVGHGIVPANTAAKATSATTWVGKVFVRCL